MKKPKSFKAKKGSDYNEMFENRINADEREFVNYDCMFQELPTNDRLKSQHDGL